MTDLADFLLARIAEDETTARDGDDVRLGGLPLCWLTVDGQWLTIWPSRVLAECEAKRRIVEIHQVVIDDEYPELNPPACARCTPMTVAYPCDTLRLLALPYADHPDYRDEWRP